MNSQTNPYFEMFEKRRLKVVEMHRLRRHQLFDRSRKILQHHSQQQQYFPAFSQHQIQQDHQESFPSSHSNEESFMDIEEDQVQEDNKMISTFPKPFQSIHMKKKSELNKKKSSYSEARRYAKMIQIPSWMNIVPEDLKNFYCCARPNGRTALLVFKQGKAMIFEKGKKMSGNKNSEKQTKNNESFKALSSTILEIVYSETTNSIFITDILIWNNNLFLSQTFQQRYAWLISNYQAQFRSIVIEGCTVKLVQYYQLKSQENLKNVYLDEVGYEKNGLLFIHKQSPYIHGLNQNVMAWKDFKTSINQNILKTKPPAQQIISEQHELNRNYIYGMGKLTKSGAIFSLEGCKIGKSQYSNVNGYIRYRILGISFNRQESGNSIEVEDPMKNRMNIRLIGFEILQYKKHFCGNVDSLSKIISQYRTIYDPLTIQSIAGVLPISE